MLQVKEEKRVEKGILSSKYSRTVSAKISFHVFTDAMGCFLPRLLFTFKQLKRVKKKNERMKAWQTVYGTEIRYQNASGNTKTIFSIRKANCSIVCIDLFTFLFMESCYELSF